VRFNNCGRDGCDVSTLSNGVNRFDSDHVDYHGFDAGVSSLGDVSWHVVMTSAPGGYSHIPEMSGRIQLRRGFIGELIVQSKGQLEAVLNKGCPVVRDIFTSACRSCGPYDSFMNVTISSTCGVGKARLSFESDYAHITASDPCVIREDATNCTLYFVTASETNNITVTAADRTKYSKSVIFSAESLAAGVQYSMRTTASINMTSIDGDSGFSGFWENVIDRFGSYGKFFLDVFGKTFGSIMFVVHFAIYGLIAYFIFVLASKVIKSRRSNTTTGLEMADWRGLGSNADHDISMAKSEAMARFFKR